MWAQLLGRVLSSRLLFIGGGAANVPKIAPMPLPLGAVGHDHHHPHHHNNGATSGRAGVAHHERHLVDAAAHPLRPAGMMVMMTEAHAEEMRRAEAGGVDDAVCKVCLEPLLHRHHIPSGMELDGEEEEAMAHQMRHAMCEHAFHARCWRPYLVARIQSGAVRPIPCMACPRPVDPRDIQPLLTPDLWQAYECAYRQLSETVRYCPEPSCSAPLDVAQLEIAPTSRNHALLRRLPSLLAVGFVVAFFGVLVDLDLCGLFTALALATCFLLGWTLQCALYARETPSHPIAACGSCGTRMCTNCAQRPHPYASCSSACDTPLAVWAREHDVGRCPACTVVIERIDGCNHVACRCGVEFCWLCGAHFQPGHFSQGTCPQFGGVGGLRRRAPASLYDNVVAVAWALVFLASAVELGRMAMASLTALAGVGVSVTLLLLLAAHGVTCVAAMYAAAPDGTVPRIVTWHVVAYVCFNGFRRVTSATAAMVQAGVHARAAQTASPLMAVALAITVSVLREALWTSQWVGLAVCAAVILGTLPRQMSIALCAFSVLLAVLVPDMLETMFVLGGCVSKLFIALEAFALAFAALAVAFALQDVQANMDMRQLTRATGTISASAILRVFLFSMRIATLTAIALSIGAPGAPAALGLGLMTIGFGLASLDVSGDAGWMQLLALVPFAAALGGCAVAVYGATPAMLLVSAVMYHVICAAAMAALPFVLHSARLYAMSRLAVALYAL